MRAGNFGVEKLGILGFSAGGKTAGVAALQNGKPLYEPTDDADRASCRPDFACLIYTAYFCDDKNQLQPEWAEKIGKQNVIARDNDHYGIGNRQYVTNVSKARALFWNIVSSFATLAGGLIAYFAIRNFEQYALIFLCFAASSMIYVAIADLIPGLHKRTSLKESLLQIALIGLGVASIWMFNLFMVH